MNLIRVGVTGSRNHITQNQIQRLTERFESLYNKYRTVEIHHGDCVGVDALAHDLAEKYGFRIVVHPPENDKFRAFKSGTEIRPEFPYLVRNKNIVLETTELIALPTTGEKMRSGTWSTVRYARRLNREITIYLPIPNEAYPFEVVT